MIRRLFVRSSIALFALTAGTTFAPAQERLGNLPNQYNPPMPTVVVPADEFTMTPVPDFGGPSLFGFVNRGNWPTGFLTGNVDFPNFIGFISNSIQSIDPRATTELNPTFGAAWLSANDATLPNGRPLDRLLIAHEGNMQAYVLPNGTSITPDRLAVGLSQGGYAVADFSSDRQRILQKLGLPIPSVDLGGQREGWLNLGGYVQYTLIADVPSQFILTAGLRWEAPSGATQLFQGGSNPAYLAPYLTVGKEFGCFHVLATTGYEFPAGSGTATTDTYYLNLHIDRKCGWLYPLIEFNGAYHTNTVNLNNFSGPLHDVIDLGTFTSSGNSLSVAVGANAVLIPGKLEFGAVYTRPITAQDHFDTNGVIVKITYRF